MRRLFSTDLSADRVELDAEQARHARKVLRLKPGDTVELFDGRGQLAEGRLEIDKRASTVAILARRREKRPRPWIDLAVAIPKAARADLLAEKVSELGADRLIPLHTERSVVEVTPARHQRLQRLAVESAKQSGRAHLMQVAPARSFDDVLSDDDQPAAAPADPDISPPPPGRRLKLMTDPDGLGTIAAADLLKVLANVAVVRLLVGPEGGWTEDERQRAWQAGFAPWRIGPHTLRVETAALAALAICRQVL